MRSTIKRSDIDAAIAKEVMGWFPAGHVPEWYCDGITQEKVYRRWSPDPRMKREGLVWNPSTDANHALEAWNKLKGKGGYVLSMYDGDRGLVVSITDELFNVVDIVSEDPMPPAIAICLALLSAVRGEQVETD